MKKLIGIILVIVGATALIWWQHEKIPLVRNLFHKFYREVSVTQYMCPMHPQIVSDKPGTCPICGMTLQPILESHEKAHEHKHPEGTFRLTPERLQTIGVKTTQVRQKPLMQQARFPGRVAFDRELYITENEYVAALNLGSHDLLQTIEKKFKRLGLSEKELETLRKTRKADETLFLPKEGSSFWIYTQVYEADLSWIAKGMKAEIRHPSDSSFALEGEVQTIEPILDPMTRTARARILVSQSPKPLKPETYVDVILKKDLGERLAIPADALVDTGTRQIVFVDLGEGFIEPRAVSVGPKAGGDYPVVEGVKAGEKVITSAHFLLDSESQIQAALKQFGEMPKGHQH